MSFIYCFDDICVTDPFVLTGGVIGLGAIGVGVGAGSLALTFARVISSVEAMPAP